MNESHQPIYFSPNKKEVLSLKDEGKELAVPVSFSVPFKGKMDPVKVLAVPCTIETDTFGGEDHGDQSLK